MLTKKLTKQGFKKLSRAIGSYKIKFLDTGKEAIESVN